MSRSQFFTQAAERYLDELDAHSITQQIDAALEQCGGFDESNTAAVAAGHQFLTESDDGW